MGDHEPVGGKRDDVGWQGGSLCGSTNTKIVVQGEDGRDRMLVDVVTKTF